MRNFKVTVNRILIFLAFASLAYAEKKSAYVMAVYERGQSRIIAQQNPAMLAPVGSLLKPFAAWYLLEKGFRAEETILCPPEQKRTEKLRCWTPGGHGAMTLPSALAQSCNYYFLSRFLGLNLAEYESWLRQRFDWPTDLKILKPANVYGFDLSGGIEAEKLLAMYDKLLAAEEGGDPSAVTIMAGLRQTCDGTLADFCRALWPNRRFRFLAGKTGTIVEGKRSFGIAFLYLEHKDDHRKIVLLCYEKNKMGSQAAMNALKILNGYHGKKSG